MLKIILNELWGKWGVIGSFVDFFYELERS